jgi:hypothetical protein
LIQLGGGGPGHCARNPGAVPLASNSVAALADHHAVRLVLQIRKRAIDYLTSSKPTIGAVKLMISADLRRIEMLEFLCKFKRPRNSPQLGESPVQFELAAQSANIVR